MNLQPILFSRRIRTEVVICTNLHADVNGFSLDMSKTLLWNYLFKLVLFLPMLLHIKFCIDQNSGEVEWKWECGTYGYER